MRYIADTATELATDALIGGKAKNLFRLVAIGLPVPKFLVIPQDALSSLIPDEIQKQDYKAIREFIKKITIPAQFISSCTAEFINTTHFAVRSSAIDEDGSDFSFAGQFESHLFVTKDNLAEKIKSVWSSAFSERVFAYRHNNKLPHIFGIAVIIQEMVDAQVAGVAFGANPLNSDKDEKLISSVYGLGEGLVSGEFNSDNFILKQGKITAQLAEKTHKITLDKALTGGTKKVAVETKKQSLRSLSNKQINEIGNILDLLTVNYGVPQDIEFAVKEEQVLLLQTRPVTTLNNKTTAPKGDYILWDNSNIIESYPGVTTPLTFSFISKSYEGAYKLFCEFMGVSNKVLKQNERVFVNTLGLINGRVYYNLKSWYLMLAMLPGYSINARFMEKMMGVKERFDIPEGYRISKSNAWWQLLKMAAQMYMRFKSLPQKREEFMQLLNATISHYKKINYKEKSANELMTLYLDFEQILLNEWKAPLLNDFFAMIWFGMLQKKCEKYRISKNPNIHNDLLCGSSDIISVQPIHRTIALASKIAADQQLKSLFMHECPNTVWNKLGEQKGENFLSLKADIERYINDFGERCVGELKLETVSYTQEPAKFVMVLKSYVQNEITVKNTSAKIEEQLRNNAEQELNRALKTNFFKKWQLKRTIKKARELVSARENLRYERTRAFGIVREIFSHIGNKFQDAESIENAKDIFYLTKEEIFSFIEGTAVMQDYKALIHIRKKEYESYRQQQPPSERFATYGIAYSNNDFFSTQKVALHEGDLSGIGCCPGIVKARVQVILNPEAVSSLNGDILVTSSTDPGWVTLFPSASGIIVERGSLLSHSAIVSREMGKPCIVSVTGLLKALNTGDEIEMDGSTGKIKIIKKA